MIPVSVAFGLPDHLPFLDVYVDTDNPLVLDPSAIRNSRQSFAADARDCLHSFFTEILRCRDSTAPADLRRGIKLLEDLHEPNETRLGLTVEGSCGKGFGPEMGRILWDELQSAVCRSAALSRLEDLPLFVPGVGKDLTSDLTTRVIFGVLVRYTHEMMKSYPPLASGAVNRVVRIWDASTVDWIEQEVSLPYADGKQLLLVPVEWTRGNLLMASRSFYNRKATETLQEDQTVEQGDAKLIPSKRLLKEQHPDVKKLNGSQTVLYLRDHGRNLVEEFRADVDKDFEAMTAHDAGLRIRRTRVAA
ncbi:hypothetical protein DM793_03535 [Paenarthrobacter nitroguajacolicus]|uniref:hypothetical protein n=1 Tax=Paenarthrobacter nitroguajacolicus TaxID=211146 RepID=UPI0015BAF7D0|nr:hypothetical protein [Paenarthrobacter nitroguajacolicus]NWL10375.1 hypothetical protein [Paenarthrobacter nitroguajacolicus]